MSALTSLDTSQHTTPISAMFHTPQELQSTAENVAKNAKLETPNVAAVNKETPKVDLNNYFSNVQPSDSNVYQQLSASQASQNLSNVIAAAVTHGMNPQDAVNIQKAKVAYETTMQAETSTFEIAVD